MAFITNPLFLFFRPARRPIAYHSCRHHSRRSTSIIMTTGTHQPSSQPPQPNGGEALVRAAMIGDIDSVSQLLSSGVRGDYQSSRNESGMTALMWAAAEGHTEIARALIDSGNANINAKNSAGLTALVYCFENIASMSPSKPPPAGFPAIGKRGPPQVKITKKTSGHLGIAKLLMVKGANVQVKNEYDETLLFLAAKKGQTELCRLLIERGVDVEAQSKGYRHTAIHVAAMENHADTVRAIAEKGANVNSRNVVGWTPLMWAAARGNLEAAQALLDSGADPNIKARATWKGGDQSETSALKEGRKCGTPERMSRLLVRGGALE